MNLESELGLRKRELVDKLMGRAQSVGMAEAVYSHSVGVYGKRPADLRYSQICELAETFGPMIDELHRQLRTCRTVH